MAASYGGYESATPVVALSEHVVAGDRSKKATQSRQLLSCTKCRERKVKCDRIKPCSACSARGHPKDCDFVVGEGNDYSPIQQSYEIRKLRIENLQLKERLRAASLPHSADEDEDGETSEGKGTKASRAAARQRRFKTSDWHDNLYFGTPGLANIIHDFANLQMGSHSLTHTIPRHRQTHGLAREMYAPEQSMHPFPVFANWTGEDVFTALVATLPDRDRLFAILEDFERRAPSCSFPHTPDEVTKLEIERFLADAGANAEKYPDMLALIFVTLATGLQMGEYDRSGGQWVEGSMAATMRGADVYIAASMQALRMSSYMHQPTLLSIQAMVMMGPYLTNSGRFLDAWTLFGTTVRMAHAIGLHRDPQLLDPAPPLRESMIRRTLWWWMLHMDQQYSVTLGRPLGISGFGDCPPPEPLTTNPVILRLGQFVDHFTIHARQILSSDGMMSVAKIDEFTDKLVGLWHTMPEQLQFNESWLRDTTTLPDWPLEVISAMLFAKMQSFLILLNRQRVERTQGTAGPPPGSPPFRTSMPGTRRPSVAAGSYSTSLYGSTQDPFHHFHPPAVRGRDLVINSSVLILQTFLFFQHRHPAVLICWTMCQQAFNASMIVLIDAWETGNTANEFFVNQAYAVFDELDKKGVHKLAKLAVQRISDGLAQLGARQQEEKRRLAMASRCSSVQHVYQPQQAPPVLQLDTASMADWSSDAVMGNTGMFLLEDPGLQAHVPPPFQPLSWTMAGSSSSHHTSFPPHDPSQQQRSFNSSNPSTVAASPTSSGPMPLPMPMPMNAPLIPLAHVTAAPFPVVMSPPFLPAGAGMIPVTNSPYAVGLQPRMPALHHRRAPYQPQLQHPPSQPHPAAFTAINNPGGGFPHHPGPPGQGFIPPHHHHQQQQPRSARQSQSGASSGGGPRGVHKSDRTPGGRSLARRK
ncbi:hypothetical protein LTR53_005325 [Teratosphaeriaceae sp. CCFEE 6253]|nr:hypothetical protein LTR53_005325 [Teratosphaeriaceae sp. CCFEE 6253]